MGKITIENIEKELCEIMERPMTRDTLQLYVLLCQAKKYMRYWERHELTAEDATAWGRRMNPPARWTMEQTNAIMQQKCYKHDPHVFYAIMNSIASDYGKTIAKYGIDKPDVWAELTNDWLDDADAVDDKASEYYHKIVKH